MRRRTQAAELGALLLLLGWACWRLVGAFPPEGRLNGDAFWTYLPAAQFFLHDPWAFLTTEALAYHVAPLGYLWPALWQADQVSTQFANCVVFMLALLMLWHTARSLGGAVAGLVTVALFIRHPDLLGFIPEVLTEAPYLFGWALALWSAVQALQSRRTKLWLSLFALGLCITLLTRPVLQYLVLMAWLLCMAAWLCKWPKSWRLPTKALALSLSAAMLLPVAFAVKNGVYFGIWGIGTGSGSGLYYGTSPFKQGAEPTYSNFHHDANIVPNAIDPALGNPLGLEADRINQQVALATLRNTTLSDNLRFFGNKLRMWVLSSTPELFFKSFTRRFRLFEWLTVLGVAALLVLQWRRHRGANWHLPGKAQLAPQRKLAVWTGLIAATGLMALQLTPVLYNGRYASYFIEPWLMVATGTALGWLFHAHPAHQNRRRTRWITALLLLAVVLWLSHALTRYSQRHEVWAIDPKRPGPTAVWLPAQQFASIKGDGMVQEADGSWRFTSEPASLQIALPAQAALDEPRVDGMWRMRFALQAAERANASCFRAHLQVEPHHEPFDWYSAPAYLFVPRGDSQAHTYMVAANGITRPRGDATISVQFHCPAGTRLSWQGLELRRSTIGPAARDHLLHGKPFDPYLNEPLGMSPP